MHNYSALNCENFGRSHSDYIVLVSVNFRPRHRLPICYVHTLPNCALILCLNIMFYCTNWLQLSELTRSLSHLAINLNLS